MVRRSDNGGQIDLSSAEIQQVAGQLSDYQGFVLSALNRDKGYADELIGIDDDELTIKFRESEKFAEKICKNILRTHSINMNNKNIHTMENAKFTAEELSVITDRYNQIHSAANESQSLKENLVSYYMSTNTELSKEEAEKVVAGLMSGVEDFTSKYKEALDEGWNPEVHIKAMVAEMGTQQRFEFLVNAISIINTLNVNTIGDIPNVQDSINKIVEELKVGQNEVTDAVCDELQKHLSELLESSTLILTNADRIKEIMDVANGQPSNVIDFTSEQYDDYRHKAELALATWIEHKNGTLTTLPSGIIPEALGVSIAAGVEEARVVEEVASGTKTLEWAIRCLKILGAVALVCFLGYIALLAIAISACAFFEASILAMGTSTIAVMVASALSFLICWGCSEMAIKAGKKVLNWSGERFDWLMTKFKQNVYPAIERGITNLVSCIRSLFQSNQTSQQALE